MFPPPCGEAYQVGRPPDDLNVAGRHSPDAGGGQRRLPNPHLPCVTTLQNSAFHAKCR
jgi:hypothetical protein